MTLQSEQSKAIYVADGATSSFPIPFYFFDKQVAVFKDNENSPFTYGTDYTLTGGGNPSGGEVVFTVPPENGAKIIIIRDVALTQLIKFIEGENFPAQDYEYALDKITMALQELHEKVDAALTLPLGTLTAKEEIIALLSELNTHLEEIKQVPSLAKAMATLYADIKDEIAEREPKRFENVGIEAGYFTADTTYEQYPYRVEIPLSGVTTAHIPSVIFALNDSVSGIFAPVASADTDKIILWAKEIPSTLPITVPNIILH
jgi:hypothetical protein